MHQSYQKWVIRGEMSKSSLSEIYRSLRDTVSEIRDILFYSLQNPEHEVAHYTSLHALKNLSKSRNRFRLYNADYMNDPEEGQVFFKIMNEYQVNIEKFYKYEARSYRSPAYIGSFVRLEKDNGQKDKLFLWRTYGKHDNEEAAGSCLIFNNEQCFAKYATYKSSSMEKHSNKENFALYEIHYRGRSNEKLEKGLEKLAGQLKDMDEFIEIVHAEEIKDVLRRFVCELLDSIRFLFKEKHYREEKEVRVIKFHYDKKDKASTSKIDVDVENIPPRFYTEAPESVRFSEVILGPRTERYQEWEQWLKAKAKNQDRSVDIKQSEIKYGKS